MSESVDALMIACLALALMLVMIVVIWLLYKRWYRRMFHDDIDDMVEEARKGKLVIDENIQVDIHPRRNLKRHTRHKQEDRDTGRDKRRKRHHQKHHKKD